MKKEKGGFLKTILLFIVILCLLVALYGKGNDKDNKENAIVSNNIETKKDNGVTGVEVQKSDEEQHGIIGIEVQKPEGEQYGSIEDFSYELSENTVILKKYNGKAEILEIKPSYTINDTDYKTDLSDFQVGIGNRKVKTLILCEGITEVRNAIFNSCDVEKVYFPKSMTVIHDNTLSYLHPDEGQTIKIYYGGTQDEWTEIFAEYKRILLEDAEFGEEMGQAAADKVNEMMGMEYDSSLFEYFFSANSDDLK